MRTFLGVLWFAFLGFALYIYLFHAGALQDRFETIVHSSIYLAYAAFLILGVLRGFTLVPVTYLIVLGLLFFSPLPLLILILAGVVVSSATVYYFFEFLHLDTFFEKNHGKEIQRIRTALEKNELPIIIAWSAMPFLPTDLICYICGTLEVGLRKMLIGVFIGEGITCALYIFFGHYLLNYFHLGI